MTLNSSTEADVAVVHVTHDRAKDKNNSLAIYVKVLLSFM